MATLFKSAAKVQPINSTHQAGSIAWLNECVERGRHEVFGLPVLLTPGLAAELLRRNPDNRVISDVFVQKYAEDILNNRWEMNGEPIIISKDGSMNDGQHRTHGVVAANRSVPVFMVFGVERDTRETVDQGKARTAGDYLMMSGAEYSNRCAAVARMLIGYERNNGTMLGSLKGITNSVIVARVRADREILNSVKFVASCRISPTTLITAAPVSFCHYLFADIDRGDADEFIFKVLTGEGIKYGAPAYAVRSRLLSDDPASRLKRGAIVAKVEVILRGWDAYRSGRTLKVAKTVGSFPALI